jgi:molybdopterin converting factor subunit 1
MQITLLYFAAVRELVQTSDQVLDLPLEVRTISDLARHLTRMHPPLEGRLGQVRWAQNEEFVHTGVTLADGDVIAVLPPLAGG